MGKTIETDGRQLPLDALKLLALVDVIELRITEAYSNSDLTNLSIAYIKNSWNKTWRLWSEKDLNALCIQIIWYDCESIFLFKENA
jgi:hypothetical protein